MHKRQIVAHIPARHAVFRHQTKTIRPAAIAPAAAGFVITLITVGDVQAQSVVIGTFLIDDVIFVRPCRQLNT
ncbi:hypothetical protein D3C73_1614020 [compost metagenome]